MIINTAGLASLRKSFSAAFQNAFATAPSQWAKVATLIVSNTESNLYAFLGQFPKLREWLGDRQVKNLAASNYTLTNKAFEATVAVNRTTIEDDTYGVYAPIMQEMGYSAGLHPDEGVFAALAAGASSLCYDGQYFFDTDHPVVVSGASTTASNYDSTGGGNLWVLMDTKRPLKPLIYQKRKEYVFKAFQSENDENVFMRNEFLYGVDGRGAFGYGLWQLAYGSLNTLNATNVQAYAATMMARKSDEDKPLNIMPNLCVVGPSNWAAARALFLVPTLSDGSANPNFGLCEVLVTPYLT
jgi:phage major head subunit gpT-like protein